MGKEIFAELEAADIVLLVISASFLASHFCYHREMKRALERHNAGAARVVRPPPQLGLERGDRRLDRLGRGLELRGQDFGARLAGRRRHRDPRAHQLGAQLVGQVVAEADEAGGVEVRDVAALRQENR